MGMGGVGGRSLERERWSATVGVSCLKAARV